MDLMYLLTGEEMYGRQAEELRRFEMEVEYGGASISLRALASAGRKAVSFGKGVASSMLKALIDRPLVSLLPWASLAEGVYDALHRQDFPNDLLGESLPMGSRWSPTEELNNRMAVNEVRVRALIGEAEDMNAYYLGRCGGDFLVAGMGLLETFKGSLEATFGGYSTIAGLASGGGVVAVPMTMAITIDGVVVMVDGAAETAYGIEMIRQDFGRYQESRAEKDSESGTEPKGNRSYKIVNGYEAKVNEGQQKTYTRN